jgi:hypothetical protein
MNTIQITQKSYKTDTKGCERIKGYENNLLHITNRITQVY